MSELELYFQKFKVKLIKKKLKTKAIKFKGHVQNHPRSKFTQSNSKTAYQLRVRVRGNNASKN